MKRIFLLLVCVALFSGCTDAEWSQVYSYGDAHVVQLYSGGKLVREWTSTGKAVSEEHTDGYYFRDAKTKQLVRVTGDLVITPQE